mmetsp:Transcript_133970/g.199251  ORF Transcript_133970/g.199251 Transcript_133970/m.199251 type:complete len:561 (-) Transcript_133970:244-1926(-)|eukprot:CAMPEP_0117035332 /NCGR_PEP_ID=MMETSP0472-20121206/25101_1 /TAXON_ID=693140 ORGANISM="Tiarina fusus, Strain LIS" /NCGR_SAMPLE_ID=MMETSP0472 /ASSEMBLY_ACC=CAM_ASM_000603 /LENGTH=560 /DNA_ID=CAMNT_0004744773 /DNA_START=82 /DNA_END=1764 /DNA_ORIENTATION=+
MMMSKPAPETSEEAPPAFATAPAPTPKLSEVEKLERQLQMLSGMGAPAAPAPAAANLKPAPTPVAAPPAPAATTVAPGKQALLARIMAAKEKNKPKAAPTPAPAVDLLSDFDAPSTAKDPPPSFNTNFLPPPSATAPPPAAMAPPPSFDPMAMAMAPPAFDSVQNNIVSQAFPPPPPIESVLPPPPAIDTLEPPPPFSVAASAPPAASAPFFEDLMDQQQTNHLAGMQAVPPPEAPPEIDESILAGLDPKEREELLAEQKKIMEQIEKDKQNDNSSEAAARAMAFNQRSSSAVAQVAGGFEQPRAARTKKSKPAAKPKSSSSGPTVAIGEGEEVPLHGQETTQQAIKDGTALVVQCINCQNWMQVAENANLMFCPVCQVVSPVEKEAAATSADMEAAAQLAADAQLAEKLQNEEYARGAGGAARPRTKNKKPAQGKVQSGQTWYDWIVGTPVEQPASAAANVPERGSAEIRRSPGLVAATTGAEGRSRSYDESESLVGGGGGGARVAESKSMFACVTDSISTAATQMTAYSLNQDEEGNVHGVDSSSLLAMSNVSRQRET